MTLWLIQQTGPTLDSLFDKPSKAFAVHRCAFMGWSTVLTELISDDLVNSDLGDGKTPLIRACKSGEKQVALVLIQHRAQLNIRDNDGDTPLITCIVNEQPELLSVLLNNGADPNLTNDLGISPLHFAAGKGNLDMVKALLGQGANPAASASNLWDFHPIHRAVEVEALDVIRELFSKGADLNATDSEGDTPLHVAAWHDLPMAAKLLLKLGAAKDMLNGNQQTPLYVATMSNSKETVRVLLDGGCNSNLVCCDGKTPLHAAAGSGELEIVKLVWQNIMENQRISKWDSIINKRSSSRNETPLHLSIETCDTKLIEFLENHGAEICPGYIGASPLHYAAHNDRKAIANLLLAQTKDPNPRSESNDTPLHFAARMSRHDFIVSMFEVCETLGLSIDVNAQNDFGASPLYIALLKGCEELAQFLLDKGAISSPTKEGNYPIHLAAWHGFDSIVQRLLDHDGVTSQGYENRTPLFCAAARGHIKVLETLILHSPNVLNVCDSSHVSPIMTALTNSHPDAAHCLLDAGVDLSIVNEFGTSVIHIAARSGDLGMVKRLLSMGCKGDAQNRFKDTPLFQAVRGGSLDIVDAILEAGFDDINFLDATGTSYAMVAAEKGDLKMLSKLDDRGAQFSIANGLGRSAAHYAAAFGQWELFKFLKDHREAFDLKDCTGCSPLEAAASEFPETVKYLIHSQPHTVNEADEWINRTPLICAAINGNFLAVRYLLEADADPYHRDALGLNALDYASRHPAILREMHRKNYFYQADSRQAQEKILAKSIERYCEERLRTLIEPSVKDECHHLAMLSGLAMTLKRAEEYDAAALCFVELYWPDKFTLICADWTCNICFNEYPQGDRYVCKSCYGFVQLCSRCHDDYEEAGRKIPPSLAEILSYESTIQSLRAAVEDLGMVNAAFAVYYFSPGTEFMVQASQLSDEWEQIYNSDNRFRDRKRPGQALIRLLKTAFYTVLRMNWEDPDESKLLVKLDKEYDKLKKECRVDAARESFICQGHDFLRVSKDQMEKEKESGIDMGSDGKLKPHFFQRVLEKHQKRQDADADDEWSTRLLKVRRSREARASELSTQIPPEAFGSREAPRRKPLKRTATMAALKPQNDKEAMRGAFPSWIPDAMATGTIKLAQTSNTHPRRSQSIPVSRSTTFTDNLKVQVRSSAPLKALKTRLNTMDETKPDPQPLNLSSDLNQTTEQLVAFAITATIPNDENDGKDSAVAANEDEIALMTSEDGKQGSSEAGAPGQEFILDSHVASVTEEPESTSDNRSDTTADHEGQANQIAYLLYQAAMKGEGDAGDFELWLDALNVNEAILPGFIRAYHKQISCSARIATLSLA